MYACMYKGINKGKCYVKITETLCWVKGEEFFSYLPIRKLEREREQVRKYQSVLPTDKYPQLMSVYQNKFVTCVMII